ncbi:5'-3' exonuclease, SAM fold family protein [Mycobacterium intracellulare 1956]|uniref:5'-3' exonuclease n=1 Tax=Mycobacterium intracellulare 1956 TaxID=1299331 RepID=X8CHM0_MYCIT|nr:5'-3' exonuclease, SAM fold family protein [Mycobacterium intracellulare 1956]
MLLDGNSLAFRAFYALPAENFKTRGGLTTNAVYGFTAMLINLLRDEAPTHIAAAFDVSRQTFRSERYPEYKANRSATPDEFHGQIDITKEVLAALGITVLAEPGFEADDLIATLATQAENEGYRVLVVTGDRDSLQLVSENVTVLYPRKGVSALTRFTPDAVVEKYGLTPTQYPDFAALRGDPSDNLPGIPGVGEKTASKWIGEYGSLQALVDNVDSVRGKVGDALREHLASVIRNRELTDLVKDVPLAQTPDTLRLQPWDRDQIHRLFDDLEFRVLRDRLFETLAAVEPEVDEGFDVRGGALEAGELAVWLAEHSSGKRFGLAVVGTHLAYDADATALAIVSADGEGRYIDTATLDPEDEAALASWLADPGRPRRCTKPSWPCTTWPGGAGRWPASPPTPRWRPTWCAPGSAASPSTTCRCATCVASCGPKTLSSNSFRCSTTPTAPTTRRCRRCFCVPWRCWIWPTRSTRSWPASTPPRCSAAWSCRCSGCWRGWKTPASPSIWSC